MKRKWSKASGLAALALSASLLVGCGGNAGTGNTESNSAGTKASASSEAVATSEAAGSTEEAKVNAPGTFPITNEKTELSMTIVQDNYVTDYENNGFLNWYEDKTNVHMNLEVLPQAGAEEKLSTKLAGMDLPDILCVTKLKNETLVAYGSQGVFMPLNDLIDQYAPHIKAVMEEYPYVLDSMVAPDGNIYNIPNIGGSLHGTMPKKGWINKTWLDNLGLEVPETIDEFYEVLKAFKEQDANGNGDPNDEIPYAGCTGANNEIEGYILQSFLPYLKGNYLMVTDGKVECAATQEAYKEGLKYLNKLFEEGLIAQESFTMDRTALTALSENPDANLLGGANALVYSHFVVDRGESGRYEEYVALPPLKGPDGTCYVYDRGFTSNNLNFVITSSCENPEAAIRWIDEIWNGDDAMKLGYTPLMGEQGVGWDYVTDGRPDLVGDPADYEWLIPFGTKTSDHLSQTLPAFYSEDYVNSQAATDTNELESMLLKVTKDMYEPYSAKDRYVPSMFFETETLETYGDLSTQVSSVVEAYMVRFVTGELDIDQGWDEYLNELKVAGLEDYLNNTQETYDLNMSNKNK